MFLVFGFVGFGVVLCSCVLLMFLCGSMVGGRHVADIILCGYGVMMGGFVVFPRGFLWFLCFCDSTVI